MNTTIKSKKWVKKTGKERKGIENKTEKKLKPFNVNLFVAHKWLNYKLHKSFCNKVVLKQIQDNNHNSLQYQQ